MRSMKKVLEAEEEYFDKIWYNRHFCLARNVELGLTTIDDEIWNTALKTRKRIEDKYGKENLLPHDDFEWGMMNGKLSALRWILGEEWDFLDT